MSKNKEWEKNRSLQRRAQRFKDRKFICVDGEGYDIDGKHQLVILGVNGRDIVNPKGLSTLECLDFLLSLPQNGEIYVGFHLNYDINKILRDVHEDGLRKLANEKVGYWTVGGRRFQFRWAPSKSFQISEFVNIRGSNTGRKLSSIILWDAHGFFQCSFAKALEAWGVGTPDERNLINEFKALRGGFSESMLESMQNYNQTECKLLTDLMSQLRDALVKAEIRVARWDGAGAIAAALMRKYNVKSHLNQELPPEVDKAAMHAYFGGRTQTLIVGIIPGPIYHYDLNSAYPSFIVDLPSLHGRWIYRNEYDPEIDFTMWHCRWNLGRKHLYYPISPFPYRVAGKGIRYPSWGEGIYWNSLVNVAKTHWPEIEVIGGWQFIPGTDELPFVWVGDEFDKRRKYKECGDPRHVVLKLGLNSLYGKMAQGVGFGNKKPAFQSYVWAGIVTAATQAALLSAGLQNPKSIIFFATDGIFSRVPLAVNTGFGLKTWESSAPLRELTVYQPGLYSSVSSEGKIYCKTRGFRPDELDWDKLREGWNLRNTAFKMDICCQRFLGLKLALHQNNMEEWGNFSHYTRTVLTVPNGGMGIPDRSKDRSWTYWEPMQSGINGLSKPYIPKQKYIEEGVMSNDAFLAYLDDPDGSIMG